MLSSRFCRAKMAECAQLASQAEDREHREAFHDLVQKWRTLAAHAEAESRTAAIDVH